MAGIRGRGVSTGKSLSILFRLIADGSQARKEISDTSKFAAKEIRAAENIGQRILSIFSRPIRGRLGFMGASGISLLRETLRGFADKEIKKTKGGLDEVGDSADKASAKIKKASTGAAASITSISTALLAIRSKPAAIEIQDVTKEFSDATFAIQTFEKVLARTSEAPRSGKTFGPQMAVGADLKALLGNLGVLPTRSTEKDLLGILGISFRNKDAQEALAEFAEGFNRIPASVDRAAIAARILGSETSKMLPILEKLRVQTLSSAAAVTAFEQASKNVAVLEKAQRELAGLTITASKKKAEATRLEEIAKKALLIAEGAPRQEATRTFAQIPRKDLPPFTRADATIADTMKIWDRYVQQNVKVRAEQSAAVAQLGENVAKAKELAGLAREASTRLGVLSGRNFDIMQGDIEVLEEKIKRTKAVIVKYQQIIENFKKQRVTGLPGDPLEQEIVKFTGKVAVLQGELQTQNATLVASSEALELYKDSIFRARKEAEALAIESRAIDNAVVASHQRVKKATEAVETDPIELTKKMRMENVAAKVQGAQDALNRSTEAGTEADAAQAKVLAKKAEVAEKVAATFGGLGVQTRLTEKEVLLLTNTLDQGTNNLSAFLNVLKQLNVTKTGPGGPKIPITIPDLKSTGNIENFVQRFASFTTEAERATFATDVLGEKLAAKLLPSLESIVPPIEAGTTALAGFTSMLIPAAIGIGVVVAASAAFLGIMFLITKHVAASDAEIGRLSERFGLTAESVSALDSAAKKANLGGIKAIQERLGSFNRILGQAARGQLPEVSFLLKKMGIDAKAAGTDTTGALTKVIDTLNNLKDPTQQNVILQQLFADRTGKVGLTMQEVGPSFVKYMAQLKESGRLLSTVGAQNALEFTRTLENMGEQFKILAVQFGRPSIPGFTIALRAANTEVRGLGSAFEFFGNVAGSAVAGVALVFAEFMGLLKTFSQGFFPGVQGFGQLLAENIADIVDGAQKAKKSEQELQDEFDKTLRMEQQQAKTAIQLKEQERDARNRIEQQITDQYRRQVDLRTASREQLAQQEIVQAGVDAQERLAVVIENQRQEAKRTTDGTKEAEDQKKANLLGYLEEIAKIINEGASKAQDIRVAEQVRIREQEDQFHDDILATQRAWADERIDVLRFEAERDIQVRQEKLQEIKVIEEAQTAAELKELERRIGAAGKDTDLLRKLSTQQLEARAKAEQAANQRQREIDQAGYDRRLADIQLFSSQLESKTTTLNARIAEIQDAAARRNVTMQHLPTTMIATDQLRQAGDAVNAIEAEITGLNLAYKDTTDAEGRLAMANVYLADTQKAYNQALEQEKQPLTNVQALKEASAVEIAILNDKIKAKASEKKLLDDQKKDSRQAQAELDQLNAQKQAAIEKSGRDIRDAYIQQAEQLRQVTTDTNNILRDARFTQIKTDVDFIQRLKESAVTTVAQKQRAIRMQFDLNIEEANLQHQANLEQIANDKEAALDSSLTDAEWLEKEEAFHAKREAEMRRHNAEMIGLKLDSDKEARQAVLQGSGFEQGAQTGQIFDLMDTMKQRLIDTGEASMTTADVVNTGFSVMGAAANGFAEALGSVVQQWILTGKTGPGVMKKIVASVLAGIAVQALTQSIMFTAYGLAALTPWGAAVYGPAAPWFQAAALMAVVAAGTAVLGRAVAGNPAAEASAKNPAVKDEIERKNEGRRQFVEHIHRVVVTGEKGFVARQLVEEIKNNNQEVRRAVNTATS